MFLKKRKEERKREKEKIRPHIVELDYNKHKNPSFFPSR